jgi:type I restriction enzyme S subunit
MSSEQVAIDSLTRLIYRYPSFYGMEKFDRGVPVIRGEHIGEDGRISANWGNYWFVTQDYSAKFPKTALGLDDIVMSVRGTVGLFARVTESHVGAQISPNLIRLSPDPLKVYPPYFYYALRDERVVAQIAGSVASSAVPALKASDIKSAKIRVLPREQQVSVAKTLRALDDLITLLRETNATLEAIAQAIFKSWFVDFDPVRAKQEGRAPEGMDEATATLFPDSFEESELGLVPRGWRVGTLGDILALRNERTKPSEETKSLPYVPIESITAKVPFLQEHKSGEEANSSLILFRKGDILFGAMRPYFHKVCIAPFDGVTRTTVFTLKSTNRNASGFALFLAFQEATIDYATQHSEGSTIPYAKWSKSLEYMPVILPPEPVQIAFSDIVSSFIGRANSNVDQAQTLAALRDTLLPRLISGQLRLPNAEDIIAETAT